MPHDHEPVEVVVAFYEDGGHYPRAAKRDPVLAYWKAIAVMASTLRVVGRDWPVTVATNRPPTDPAIRQVLDEAGVGFRDTPFDHRPPAGWFDRFTGSLYLLDALADAVDRAPSGSRVMVVDPDCVWVNDPAPMLAAVDADPDTVLAYEITYTPGQPALGLTQEQMSQLFRSVGTAPVPARAPYAGGEFLLGTRDRLAQVVEHAEAIWQASLRRFADGDPLRVNTEEHVLSYALGQLGWTGGTANPFMRRLWTQSPPNRNVQGDEEDLVLWHALTEKHRGLQELFDDLAADHPALAAPGPTYRRHLARRLRVHLPPVVRLKLPLNQWTYRLRGGRRQWPVEW